MKTEIIYLVSNIVISLYGVLIKYYSNISVFEQLFLRTLAFVAISILALGYNKQNIYNNVFTYESMLLSIINLSSIYGIYISFRELGIGTTNSLFYTWPIMLYLFSIPVLNNKFTIKELSILLITTISMILILYEYKLYYRYNWTSRISIYTHSNNSIFQKKKY